MAYLPPVPLGTPATQPNYWSDWYNKVRDLLNGGLSILWSAIDKTGSQLSDIVTRPHSQLQSIQGGALGEYYHLTAAQYASLGVGAHNSLASIQGGTTGQYYHLTAAEYGDITYLGNLKLNSKSSDPTTTDIPAGYSKLYKNTTSSAVKLWVNDGGTLKSVTLT